MPYSLSLRRQIFLPKLEMEAQQVLTNVGILLEILLHHLQIISLPRLCNQRDMPQNRCSIFSQKMEAINSSMGEFIGEVT